MGLEGLCPKIPEIVLVLLLVVVLEIPGVGFRRLFEDEEEDDDEDD